MKRRGWSKDQERKRRKEDMTMGNGTNNSNKSNGKTIHIPEILDDNSGHTEMLLTEQGTLPALRFNLREALGGFQARQSAAIDDIIKTTAAETEFLEKVAKQRKAQYVDTINFHEKLGA